MGKPIYLDYNATTPHDPEVIDAMRLFLEEEFGNPSSSHWYGIKPKKAVIEARSRVADLLNCAAEEIIFTSGGTESNNQAIKGLAEAHKDKGNHIITSQIEHPAVLEVCIHLEANGFEDHAEFMANHKVEIVSSLPYYKASLTDKQRGSGVFEKSVSAIKKLNDLGYAKEGTGLLFNLVYNPVGAFTNITREFGKGL